MAVGVDVDFGSTDVKVNIDRLHQVLHLSCTPNAGDVTSAVKANRAACDALDARDVSGALWLATDAIVAHSKWPTAWHTCGITLLKLGLEDMALEMFDSAIACDSAYDPAYIAKFILLKERGDFEDALATLDRLDANVPGLAESNFLRSATLLGLGDYEQAAEALDLGLRAPTPTPNSRMLPYGIVSEPRLVQDREQLRRFLATGKLDAEVFETVLMAYEMAIEAFPREAEGDWTTAPTVHLDPELISLIRPFYRRAVHLERADRTEFPALSESVNGAETKATYFSNKDFPAVVIDDILEPRALDTLLNYLYESTIWHNDAQMGRNYVGAYRQNGLSCPLIEQIGEELQTKFSGILQPHDLLEFWAYRMIMGESGVGAHADSTAINVNIWLTPPSAEGEGGGLVLYDRIAPADWSYHDYNANPDLIRAYLADTTKTAIEYRQNRAIIFNSRLFHETGPLQPIKSYEQGRINLTFLFGCGTQ